MMLLLLLLSPCLSSRIQEQGSRIQEARSQEARSQEAILVVGGSVGGAEDQQDSRTTELLLADCPVADLPRVNYNQAVFTMEDDTILSCGGTSSDCLQLSQDLTSWSLHSRVGVMGSMTSNVIAAVLPSGAFLMGRTAGAFLPTGATSWQSFHTPQDHDSRPSCTVAISDTSFLLIGGFWEAGDFIDQYDSQTGEWTRWQERLPEKRENMRCARLGGEVFLTGGYNRGSNSYDGATVILDLASRQFRRGGDMTWEREGHGLSVLDSGRMIAYGGSYYGDSGVEEWQPETETWGLLQDTLGEERASFGSTVITVTC